jgi:hypothetical protein
MKKLIIIILFCLALIGAWIFALTVARADVIAPDGIILINNNVTTTYSRNIELLIPAQDDNEIVDMCISAGMECTQWEPYRKSRYAQLLGSNTWYSFCARVRDGAGNESVMKCVVIQYIGN